MVRPAGWAATAALPRSKPGSLLILARGTGPGDCEPCMVADRYSVLSDLQGSLLQKRGARVPRVHPWVCTPLGSGENAAAGSRMPPPRASGRSAGHTPRCCCSAACTSKRRTFTAATVSASSRPAAQPAYRAPGPMPRVRKRRTSDVPHAWRACRLAHAPRPLGSRGRCAPNHPQAGLEAGFGAEWHFIAPIAPRGEAFFMGAERLLPALCAAVRPPPRSPCHPALLRARACTRRRVPCNQSARRGALGAARADRRAPRGGGGQVPPLGAQQWSALSACSRPPLRAARAPASAPPLQLGRPSAPPRLSRLHADAHTTVHRARDRAARGRHCGA